MHRRACSARDIAAEVRFIKKKASAIEASSQHERGFRLVQRARLGRSPTFTIFFITLDYLLLYCILLYTYRTAMPNATVVYASDLWYMLAVLYTWFKWFPSAAYRRTPPILGALGGTQRSHGSVTKSCTTGRSCASRHKDRLPHACVEQACRPQ